MTYFNFSDYLYLKDHQVLRMKLKGKDEIIYVHRVSQDIIQSYQPAHTPITKINLDVIRVLDLHKQDKQDYENHYELKVEPNEVEEFELIEI